MSTETLLRLFSFLALVVAFGISISFRRRADKADGSIDRNAEDQRLLRIRNIGVSVFYLTGLAFLISPPSVAWAALPLPLAVRWFGLAMMGLALPLLYWMFSNLGKNITPTVKTRKQHNLVTKGPYRYIRHPLYSFGSLLLLGFCLVASNWLMMTGAAVGMWALLSRTPQEEEMLIQKFGDRYRNYMKRTGKYFPKLSA